MKNEVLYRPSYALLQLTMEPGEQVQAESGAMVSMTPNIQMETQARGGCWAGSNAPCSAARASSSTPTPAGTAPVS